MLYVLTFAKEWRIGRLRLPNNMGAEGWEALNKVVGKGKVDNVNVNKLTLGETDGEVKTLCSVIAFAKQWRVNWLLLPEKMGAESWEALSKVASKVKVNIVTVSKLALKTANNQQLEALWLATELCWEDYDDRKKFVHKSDGAAGLQRLLFNAELNRTGRKVVIPI